MNAKTVDVLALFDAYIAHGIPQERRELQEARAAVAELIEVSKRVHAAILCGEHVPYADLGEALARCGAPA